MKSRAENHLLSCKLRSNVKAFESVCLSHCHPFTLVKNIIHCRKDKSFTMNFKKGTFYIDLFRFICYFKKLFILHHDWCRLNLCIRLKNHTHKTRKTELSWFFLIQLKIITIKHFIYKALFITKSQSANYFPFTVQLIFLFFEGQINFRWIVE